MLILFPVFAIMLKIVTLTGLLSVAVATPGYLHSAPIVVNEEVLPVETKVYPSVPVHTSVPLIPAPAPPVQPEDVTYTRTHIITSKVTSSAPHPHAHPLAAPPLPHSIKNTYYTEENIVRGQQAPIHVEAPEVEANLRKIEINAPQPLERRRPPQAVPRNQPPVYPHPHPLQALPHRPEDIRGIVQPPQPIIPEPPLPLHPQPEEIPAPVLRPFPQPSERIVAMNAPPQHLEPNLAPVEPLPHVQPAEIIPKTVPLISFPTIYAHQTPLASIQRSISVGYPISAAKVHDVRKTFYTPISTSVKSSAVVSSEPQVVPAVTFNQPLVTHSVPCEETPAVIETKVIPGTGVRTQISHGNGAISTIYY